jgi:hypothetical protein
VQVKKFSQMILVHVAAAKSINSVAAEMHKNKKVLYF